MAEPNGPKLRTTPEQRARWSRFDGWPGWLCGDIKTLLARVRELEADCETLMCSNSEAALTVAQASVIKSLLLAVPMPNEQSKACAQQAIGWLDHMIKAEREGAAVVKLEHLEKIRWQRLAIGAKRNGSLVYVTRCLGCGCSKSTEDGPDCWIAAAIRAAGGER